MVVNIFGKNSKKYDSIRHDYPAESIEYIKNLSKGYRVLDLGCGTGISTRQLMEIGYNVTGIDGDDEMINIAKDYCDRIKYTVSFAESLPFENESFDMVTAFGSFHWFCNEKAISEIKRVLVNGGMFIVVNKWDTGKYFEILKNVLRKFECENPGSVKQAYIPEDILTKNGFIDINKKIFNCVEQYGVDEIVAHAQTSALWNYVSQDKKFRVIDELKREYLFVSNGGNFSRELDVVIVSGIK
jgi:ubiquinone/menaquinone biosynthesis C-methylase UbiE